MNEHIFPIQTPNRTETFLRSNTIEMGLQVNMLDSIQTSDSSLILQSFIDASGSNMAVLDKRQTILYVNRAWRQFACQTGSVPREYGVGCRYSDLGKGTIAASGSDSNSIAAGIDSLISGSETEFQLDYKCTAVAEPEWFRVHAAAFYLPDHDGNPMILVSHDNITLEMQANSSLRRDKELLQRLLNITNIIPWEANVARSQITHIGEQAGQILGYPAQMWFEPDFWITRVHPDDREKTASQSDEYLQSVDLYQSEYRMIAANGRTVWINDIVSVERSSGNAARMHGFMIDVTERKESEHSLALVSGRLITAQEEERKRIARELHDDINQRMALLSIELEQVGQLLAANSNGLSERVKGLQKKALDVSTEIHRMSYKLHPSKLEHLGLAPALKSFCDELAQRRGFTIDFRHQGFPAILPMNITLCVFRIAQEALQNAAKHSGASNIAIRLEKSDDAVVLSVSDPGRGFEINSEKMAVGLGFISMRERLRLINGTIDIRSKPQKGTEIIVSVPL